MYGLREEQVSCICMCYGHCMVVLNLHYSGIFDINPLSTKKFFLNLYYLCVANKVIDGKQCTIVWYVDDNKISHTDENVLTNILEKMKGHFGDIKIYRGNSHVFLGIGIVLRDDVKFEVEMKDKLLEAIEMFGEDITER